MERSDVNAWLSLNVRPRVPSLDVGGFVDAVVVVTVAVAFVIAVEAAVAVVGAAVDVLMPVTTKFKLLEHLHKLWGQS